MQKGDPIKLNFEGFEIQKWNIPTDRWERWERLGEKNVVIFLVIMINSRVLVIKMSKMSEFL